ncbi:MAG: tetratricopeptide repeat protein [Terriglobia bacterium]
MIDNSWAPSPLSKRIAFCAVVALLVAGFLPTVAQNQPPKPQPVEKHYQAARDALSKGDTATANIEVKLALQNNPLDAPAHFLLASLLALQGENDQAIVGFQRAVNLDPANAEALYNLGTMLLWRGEALEASRLLENAVLIRPGHVPSYNNLAKAYFMTGLPEMAIGAYEEALRRDPANAIALKNLAALAAGAGLKEAAASYMKRLESLGLGQTALPAVEPITLLPTWPLATTTLAPPLPSPPAASPAPKPETRVDPEANALRELLRDLSHVTVERRGGRLTLTGWTSSPKEKELLGKIIAGRPDILDLTSDDVGDPHRMIEVDAVLFVVIRQDQQNVGFNFLNLIHTNFTYFANGNANGIGLAAPGTVGSVINLAQHGWLFVAAVDYNVNIANVNNTKVAILARPHLTALSGSPATFIAGADVVFSVSGLNSGDIKPYPVGTTLRVTPTLLRTLHEDGKPQIRLTVEAGRKSLLPNQNLPTAASNATVFDDVQVNSEALVPLDQTLILSGLSQREAQSNINGVPGLMYVPIIKYFFSTKTTIVRDTAVISLLTPRDPAYWSQRNRKELDNFVEMRRAFLRARQGTEAEMQQFREAATLIGASLPNRFARLFSLLSVTNPSASNAKTKPTPSTSTSTCWALRRKK